QRKGRTAKKKKERLTLIVALTPRRATKPLVLLMPTTVTEQRDMNRSTDRRMLWPHCLRVQEFKITLSSLKTNGSPNAKSYSVRKKNSPGCATSSAVNSESCPG